MTTQLETEITAAAVCDGGNLDCGSGLLLIIRRAMDNVPTGEVLEIRSTEISVSEDLPSWCRLTENPFLGWTAATHYNRFFVRRGATTTDTQAELARARHYRWQCRTHWNGGLTVRTTARNHAWSTGQPASFDVKDDAPSAVEYLLGALSSALVMAFQVEASRSGIEIQEAEMSLSGALENVLVFLGLEEQGRSGFSEIIGTLYAKSEASPERLEDVWQQVRRVSPLLSSLSEHTTLNLKLQVLA
jgi:TusA-related sulfurtransferase